MSIFFVEVQNPVLEIQNIVDRLELCACSYAVTWFAISTSQGRWYVVDFELNELELAVDFELILICWFCVDFELNEDFLLKAMHRKSCRMFYIIRAWV